MNDIYCAIEQGILFNYADDNTVLVQGKDATVIKDKIIDASANVCNWCSVNQMEANPGKFQVMLSNEKTPSTFNLNGIEVISESNVKLLGVQLDNKLNFSAHIDKIVKSAGNQLNCLKRVTRILDEKSKINIYRSFILSHFN